MAKNYTNVNKNKNMEDSSYHPMQMSRTRIRIVPTRTV